MLKSFKMEFQFLLKAQITSFFYLKNKKNKNQLILNTPTLDSPDIIIKNLQKTEYSLIDYLVSIWLSIRENPLLIFMSNFVINSTFIQ